jgi:hypothetical protein
VGKYTNIKREEELKNKVEQDFFSKFDCTEIIKDIDFSVRIKRTGNVLDFHNDYLLWAEAKKQSTDKSEMLAQLVLTIGKARTFDKILPPSYLGCFDCDKITFIEYHEINEIFYITDINWNVAPNKRDTKEFKRVQDKINSFDESKFFVFDFVKDESALRSFIKNNFNITDAKTHKIQIDRKNFIIIYNRWRDAVKPTINYPWELSRRIGVIDGDFYLADLLSSDNKTLAESLNVLLKTDYYEAERRIDLALDIEELKKIRFTDKQKAHKEFWRIYERPPEEEFWDYFQTRRDLLVPKDIRERKGSFFTPEKWVELSQKYITKVFGKDWQNEYYVWDCAAGTGNLLAGLTNTRNIWASTLDQTDVDIMHSRIKHDGLNLLEDHCFRFDFLNDDFKDLPKKLRDIIKNTPEKLIVYINPPYAETMSKGTEHKAGLNKSAINDKYIKEMGNCANRELFIQFLIRIYKEIKRCKIANFAKLKVLCASNFVGFRHVFQAKLKRLFVVPANTFDNVVGQFPIGFHIWDTDKKELFKRITADIFDKNGKLQGQKTIYCYDGDNLLINEWIISTRDRTNEKQIGFISCLGNDFQHNNIVFIMNEKTRMASPRGSWITDKNLTEVYVYYAVRHTLEADWLNDRDQFLYPNDSWQTDKEFQSDCLAYTLFHNNNNISSKHGTNHWIPFTESEVSARDSFDSCFMTDFIAGKLKHKGKNGDQLSAFERENKYRTTPLKFSVEAKAVFKAGQKLWTYYHAQPKTKINVNASFYDIRAYFQGRNGNGRMNPKSDDETYNKLIETLRISLKILAKKIEPKIYEHGFLRE